MNNTEFITCDVSDAELRRRKAVRDESRKIGRMLRRKSKEAEAEWDKLVGTCNSIEEQEQLNAYRLSPADVKTLKPYVEKIRSLLNKSVTNVIQAGAQLIEAKKIAGHGHWCKWIQDNCGISQDSVTRYMKLAEINVSNPELLKNVTSLNEAYILCGMKKPKSKASPVPPVSAPAVSDAAPLPPAEPAKPPQPPIVAPSTGTDVTPEAQRQSGSGGKQAKVSYLEKAFDHGRLTLGEAVEFLIHHKEEIEDITLLKPLADYYAMKTVAVQLNTVESQKGIAA